MSNQNSLNPDGLPEIEAVLNRDKAEQLWFFLDDSIPTKENEAVLEFDGNDWQSQLCTLADYCFSSETVEDLKKANLEYMKPYLPLLKDCYIPYVYTVETHPETSEQKSNLEFLEEDRYAKATIEKQNDSDVPATITLTYYGITRQVRAYLSYYDN